MAKVLDLFSGIGGFSIGMERAGFSTIQFCESNPFCRSVLAKHWPGVPVADDIRSLVPMVADIICGGFPCQDASIANPNGLGIHGPRTGLWTELKRLASAIRPKAIVLENVPNLRKRGFGVVLGDLAEIGYDAEWRCISAYEAGYPHIRERLWIVAYPSSAGLQRSIGHRSILSIAEQSVSKHSDAPAAAWRAMADNFSGVRVDDGLPLAVHRRRVRAIGNSLVPDIVEAIAKEIAKQLK
jgi:DNA (cytosine-5)-methyltransferase 1